MIVWNRPKFERLKKAYAQAVEEEAEEFTFDSNVFVTGYAKYLIEYLELRFTGQDNP